MAEKNSLWKNIRKKAEQNRRTGNKPKEPTKEMLDQERKIKSKQYYNGGPTGDDEDNKIIDPTDYLISKVIMNRSKDQNLDQTAPINNNEDGAPYKPLSVPMVGYEPDPSFYNTPSKTETTKASNKTENKKPVNKPENKKPENNKPVNKPNNVKSNTGNSEISPYTRFLLDSYKYKNQNSQNSQYTEPRYIAERDDTSTRLSPAMSTKEWKEGPRSFGPTLKDLDVVTDVMQLGNFVPHPAGQIIGQLGNWGGAAIDSYQAYDDYNEGNYGSMAANIGSAVLGAYLGGRGYRRDMNNTVPGSMADKIASFGSRSGSYRPLTALPKLRNNAVIQRGLNFNRSSLGGLGLETIYDSNDYFETGNGYLLPEIEIFGDKIKPEERLIKVEGRERYDGGGDVPPISIEDYLKVYEDALRVDRILKANKNYKPRSEYSISLDPRSDTKTYLDYLKKSRDDFNTNYNSKKRKKELNNILSTIQQGKEGKRPKEYTEEEWAEELKNAERDYKYNYWATPDDYYKEVSPNSFYQRELNTSAMNPDLPMMYYDKRITPTKYNIYDDLGESLDTYGVYTYDPIVLKEEILKNYPNSEKLINEIENPTLETSKTKTSKIDIPYLPSKTFEGFKSPELSFNLTPTTLTSSTPADNMWDGTFQKYKRATYEDPVYRVWLPNQQMQIMSEEDFKKLGNLNLKNLDEKAQGGYLSGDDDKKKKLKIKEYTNRLEFNKANKAYNDSLMLSTRFPMPPSNYIIEPYEFDEYIYEVVGTDASGADILRKVKNTREAIEPIGMTPHGVEQRTRYREEGSDDVTESAQTNRPIYKAPEVKPVFRQLEIQSLPSKPYKGESTEPTIIPTPPKVDFGKPNLDNFFEGTYEKYRRSPYEDPMYRVWISGQEQQIVPESEFKKLSDQYLLKDLEAPDPGGNLYDKPKATGGYMYNGGGKIYANKQGVIMGPVQNPDGTYTLPVSSEGLPQVNLPEFEVVLEANPYGPITGEEFLESNFNPINWVLPSVENYKPKFRPDGTLIPASGKIDPHYIEGEFIGTKKGKQAIDKFVDLKDLDYKDFIKTKKINDTPKQLPSSSNTFKSEIDWGKWNSEIPSNKALMDEYYAIEQQAKADGTWMKNPDGSKFVGTQPTADELAFHKIDMTPEEAIKAQFIQQNSKNFKANMPYIIKNEDGTVKINYHNSWADRFESFNDNFFGKSDYGWYGKGVYTHPSREYTKHYGNNTYPLYINSKNPGVIDKSNIQDALYYGRTKEEIKDLLEEDYKFMMSHDNFTGLLNSDIKDIFDIIKAGGYKKYIAKTLGPLIKRTDDILKHVESKSLNDFSSFYNPKNQETVIPFNNYPKSALGNNGMFDMSNPNIYKVVVPPAAIIGTGVVGAGAMQDSQPEQQSQGGHINPYMYYAGGPMQSTNNKYSKNNIMKYKRGGGVGGFFKDYGKIMLNAYASPFEALAGKDFYDPEYNTKFGEIADVVNETTTKIGLPIAGSMLLGPQGYQAVKKGTEILSNEFIDTPQEQQQQYPQQQYPPNVNQGLSFAATGGNINNNSLNLQNSTMKRYKDYKTKYSKGGNVQNNAEEKLEYFGMTKVPSYSGYHYENPNGGSYGGENASFEKNEIVLHAKGGSTPGPGKFVFPSEVNGTFSRPAFLEVDENGIPKPLNKTISEFVEDEATKGSPFRKYNNLGEERVDTANQKAMEMVAYYDQLDQQQEQQRQAMVNGALQYAAAGGKLNKDITKIVEEEYAAAYGGYINPKKYKGLNMPYSSGGKLPKEVLRARVESHMSPQEADAYVNQYAKGGGIHIKKSKRGTFTAAAKKRGKSVQEFARQVLANKGNYSAAMVKKANFARNAASWKHAEGGDLKENLIRQYAGKITVENWDNIQEEIINKYNISAELAADIVDGARNFSEKSNYPSIYGYNLPLAEPMFKETQVIEGYDERGNPRYEKEEITNDGIFGTDVLHETYKYTYPKYILKEEGSYGLKPKRPFGYGQSDLQPGQAKGGPIVSNVAQPFQVAAQNRGGMMMAQGGNMYDPCPPDHYWDEDEGKCIPMVKGLPSRENIYNNPEMLKDIQRLNYKRAIDEYKEYYNKQGRPKNMPDPYFSPKNFVLPDEFKNKNYYPIEGDWDEKSKYEFNRFFDPMPTEQEKGEMRDKIYFRNNPKFKDFGPQIDFDYWNIPEDDPSRQYEMNEDELRDLRYEEFWCPCYKMKEDPDRSIAGKPVLKKVCVPCEEDSDNSNMLMANGGMMPQSSQQDQMIQMMQQVQEMLMKGANPQELLKQLMKSGLPQDQAQQLVQAAMQDLQSQQQPQQFQMARGGRVQYSPGGKTEENWFDEPAYTKAFRYAPLIPSTAAIATGLQNKKRTLTPSLITAPQIDLERARINLKEEGRRGLDSGLRTIRGNSGSSGQLISNTASAIQNYNKNMAANLSKLYQDEETTNAQYRLQSLLSNQQHLNDFKTKNEEMFQNAQNVALKGTQEGVLGLQKALQDERAQKLQEFIAKYRMNTRSYGLDSKGRDIYIPPKDYLTEEDIDLNTNDMWDDDYE